MRPYFELMQKVLERPVITRGARKGAYRLWRIDDNREHARVIGDRIEFYIGEKQVAVATPDTLTITMELKHQNSEIDFCWRIFGMSVCSYNVHSFSQRCITPNAVYRHKSPTYRFTGKMTFLYNGTLTDPMPFFGKRRPKDISKRTAAAINDIAPMIHLTMHQPDHMDWGKHQWLQQNAVEALLDPARWDELLNALVYLRRHWYDTEGCNAHETILWLRARCAEYKETYITQTYEVLR